MLLSIGLARQRNHSSSRRLRNIFQQIDRDGTDAAWGDYVSCHAWSTVLGSVRGSPVIGSVGSTRVSLISGEISVSFRRTGNQSLDTFCLLMIR